MYPDLSYLFHDLIGTNPDNWLAIFKTFGFFLALSFLVAAWFFHTELKRKADEGKFVPTPTIFRTGVPASIGEILGNALMGFIFFGKAGYAYQFFTNFRQDPASIILSTKMHWPMAILGMLVFGGLFWYDAYRKRGLEIKEEIKQIYPHHRVSEMTVYAAIFGILGAKIFDLFDNWESFIDDPIGSFTSGGGLAFLGGLIFGFIGVVWYILRKKMPFLHLADAVAPALAASYGSGRIGCQLSGDGDWGIVNTAPKPNWMSMLPDWMWSYTYPHHVLDTPNTDPVNSVPIDGCTWEYCMQLSQGVFPTPFYEIVMMTIVVGILWLLRKRINAPGVLFAIYLIFTGLERFIIEKIRVNVVHDLGGIKLTQAEIISLILMVIGLVMAIFCWKKAQKEA
jgi:phosphatidylglycerol---prolipoprotein diacylglyceryl transferase